MTESKGVPGALSTDGGHITTVLTSYIKESSDVETIVEILSGPTHQNKMVEQLCGTWKLDTSEGFDELLKELNVGFMLRKVAATSKPNVEISKDGDEWTIKTISIKTTVSKFKIGEEFEEHKADGSKGKSTFTIEGDKLLQKSDNNGKDYYTTREIENGKLKVTVKAGNVTCIRTYVRA